MDFFSSIVSVLYVTTQAQEPRALMTTNPAACNLTALRQFVTSPGAKGAGLSDYSRRSRRAAQMEAA